MKTMMRVMLVALVAAFASCKSGDDSVALLKSNEWQLKSLTLDGTVVTNPAALPVLTFSDSTKVAGSAGCNRFFGTYTTGEKGAITIVPGGMTMMACPDMQFEGQYMKALAEVKNFTATKEQLTLKDNDGKVVIVYTSAQ